MKTQLSKPSRTKARYTEEYKQEALELWRNSGRSAAKVAAELGIRAPLLYRWARPKRQSNSSASESKSKRSVEELEAEIRRLQAESSAARLQTLCSRARCPRSGLAVARGWPDCLAAASSARLTPSCMARMIKLINPSPTNSATRTEPINTPVIAIIPVSSNMGFLLCPALLLNTVYCRSNSDPIRGVLCGRKLAKNSGNFRVGFCPNLDLISNFNRSKELFEIGAVHANAAV